MSSKTKVAGASSSKAHQRKQDAPTTINPVGFDGVGIPCAAPRISDHFVDVTKMIGSANSKPIEFDGIRSTSTNQLIP